MKRVPRYLSQVKVPLVIGTSHRAYFTITFSGVLIIISMLIQNAQSYVNQSITEEGATVPGDFFKKEV